jgi:hypothetical protein
MGVVVGSPYSSIFSASDFSVGGFAVNADTGLQALLMHYKAEQVPISWINRTSGMGTSSFRLKRVGGGYWEVLTGLWLKHVLGIGPYRKLARRAARESPATEGLPNTTVL